MQTNDPIIMFAVRMQQAMKDLNKRQFIKAKMPQAWHVIQLGSMDSSSQMRGQVQACLIKQLTPQKTAQRLGWITTQQVRLYKDLFCDISGALMLSGWFQQMLLQPAQKNRSNNLFRARALAHYHSLDAAISSLRFGSSTQSAKQAMTKMWKDQRSKKIFDYMATNLNVPVQVYVNSLQQSIKSLQDRQFTRQLRGQTSQDNSIMEIAKAIQSGVRGFTKAQITEDSQQMKSGIDFTAAYLQLNKGQQNGGSKTDRPSDVVTAN